MWELRRRRRWWLWILISGSCNALFHYGHARFSHRSERGYRRGPSSISMFEIPAPWIMVIELCALYGTSVCVCARAVEGDDEFETWMYGCWPSWGVTLFTRSTIIISVYTRRRYYYSGEGFFGRNTLSQCAPAVTAATTQGADLTINVRRAQTTLLLWI